MSAGEIALTLAGALGFDVELLARYGPAILRGVGTTLSLVAISVPLGFALALLLAVGRLEGGGATRATVRGFVGFFRGTPVLCQLFLSYYGAGQFHAALQAAGLWWLLRDAFWCAVIVFTLNTAAYQSEILRGAAGAVPDGQVEAGRSLGMGRAAIYQKILLPQALTLALRPLGNELILMIKASSVASVVTVTDILGATRRAFSGSLDFEVYLWAALIYLVIVEIIRRLWNAMERRMTRHLGAAA